MTDSSEGPSRRLHIVSSTSHLQYPTLPPLSGSVEEWLSRSRPINMTSMDEPRQSLSESWATLSASDAHSEDGAPSEQTDLGSLIDPSGPDDVASLDDQYSSHDEMDENYEEEGVDNEGYESRSDISESRNLHPLFSHGEFSIDDSNLTTQTAFRQSTKSIEFIEPDKWPEVERVQLKHTVRLIDGPELAELGDNIAAHLHDSTLMATVQQTITKKSITTDKPFRVLYIGSSEFRSIILDKLGDVLVSSTSSGFESSSTESSRYHVVPTSFGAGAVPNFAELLPIHFQLIVDECLEATSESHIDRPRTINLKFKNRPACTSLWTGSEYGISSSTEWTLPDMAITFLSSLDNQTAMDTQRLARMFMERHGVPAMVISEKPLWKMSRELIPVNHHSLHMCLESRHSSTGKTTVLKRYPIDLSTFESITPGQLNKNLASLTSIYPRKHFKSTAEATVDVPKAPAFNFKNLTRKVLPLPYLNNDTELAFILRLIMVTIISLASLTFGHLALRATAIFVSSFFARSVPSSQIFPVSSVHTTSVLPTADLKQTHVPLLSATTRDVQVSWNQPNSLSQLQSLMAGARSKIEPSKPSEDYEIQVVGDCHLVIKPPTTSGARKSPKFDVQVHRREQPLQYELSRLFEGVYSLRLERGEAYGLVNVTITADKPAFKQVVSLDLGTPWLKIANWKRAARTITSELVRDMSTAQTGLSEVYDRVSTEVQILVGDVVKRTHLLRQKASLIRPDTLHVNLGAREAISSTSKQLSEVFHRTAVQPFLSAASVLQGQTRKVNNEAKQVASSTWSRISAGARRLSADAMREHVVNVRKSKTLDKAHKRARRLMKGNTS
ncbi:uncharacterized protein BDV17DRAFT_26186 [Aspergillus undulatus]|uniref:uncharacterized protein n=1 Tax=Aspergillus undulatus TaxID=1810928 RepID=UPI003CCDB8DB